MTCDHIPIDDHGDRRSGNAVRVGTRVRVLAPWGEDEYVIVSSRAADPRLGRISSVSPVGAALLGLRAGEEVSVQTPGGVQRLAVLAVASPAATLVPAGVHGCSP